MNVKRSVDEVDEDVMSWVMSDNVREIARAEVEILWESYDYEFSGLMDKEEYLSSFGHDRIAKITLVEVDPRSRGNGFAGKILDTVMSDLRNEGIRHWFLNASPLDKKGLGLRSLEKFYGRRGFLIKRKRKSSTLMWFKD